MTKHLAVLVAAGLVTVEHRVLGEVSDDDRAGLTEGRPRTLTALAAAAR